MKPCSIAIPARIASSRLPGKLLKPLGGKPVLQHVIERVQQVRNCNAIYVVTESPEIVHLAQSLGAIGVLSSPECRSGTERIASVLKHLSGEWILNVQGDEPFVDPQLIEEMLDQMPQTDAPLMTPIYRIDSLEELQKPSVVKVVLDQNQKTLYFSRSPIPYVRDLEPQQWLSSYTFWGHIGIYGYRRELLERYPALPMSSLEQAESLEQLRFLANGYPFLTCETTYRSIAIDTAADLAHAESLLAKR